MLFVAIALSGVLSVVFIWSIVAATRQPDRVERFYDQRRWSQATAWTLGITAAALLGAFLGGGSETVVSVIAVLGLIAAFVCSRFARAAATNRMLKDFFDR